MPNRILRETILDSELVDKLSVPAEVFYRRLMSVVDDFGRYDARPLILKTRCYPLRVTTVREADITRWLAECESAGLLALYSVDGKPYLLFGKMAKPRAISSKYPAPPPELEQALRAHVSACAQVRPYSDSFSYSDSLKKGVENPAVRAPFSPLVADLIAEFLAVPYRGPQFDQYRLHIDIGNAMEAALAAKVSPEAIRHEMRQKGRNTGEFAHVMTGRLIKEFAKKTTAPERTAAIEQTRNQLDAALAPSVIDPALLAGLLEGGPNAS